MANHASAPEYDVAHIAGQILSARSTLDQARRIIRNIHPRDTFEQERLEVLEGAVDGMGSPVLARAQAATQVLRQLAGQPATSSSIKARRAPVLTICPVKPVVPFRVQTALRSTG
jgi:hypothetical protein